MLSINYAMRIFTFERPVLQHECTTTRFRVLIFGTQGVNISSIFLIISKCLLYTKIWKKYVLSITHSDDFMRSNSLTHSVLPVPLCLHCRYGTLMIVCINQESTFQNVQYLYCRLLYVVFSCSQTNHFVNICMRKSTQNMSFLAICCYM